MADLLEPSHEWGDCPTPDIPPGHHAAVKKIVSGGVMISNLDPWICQASVLLEGRAEGVLAV